MNEWAGKRVRDSKLVAPLETPQPSQPAGRAAGRAARQTPVAKSPSHSSVLCRMVVQHLEDVELKKPVHILSTDVKKTNILTQR